MHFLMRYNSCTITFTLWKDTIQWLLVYSKSYATINSKTFSSSQKDVTHPLAVSHSWFLAVPSPGSHALVSCLSDERQPSWALYSQSYVLEFLTSNLNQGLCKYSEIIKYSLLYRTIFVTKMFCFTHRKIDFSVSTKDWKLPFFSQLNSALISEVRKINTPIF